MKKSLIGLLATGFVLSCNAAAFAGSSSGGGPAGEAGSSGSEPAIYALILLSLIPGLYFVRRARAAQPIPIPKNQ